MRPSRSSRTWADVVGLTRPDRLAEGAASGVVCGAAALVPLEEMSVVTAPYEVNGKIVGTLGVIGPTRMAYNRVIPIVDITARLLSLSLSQQ